MHVTLESPDKPDTAVHEQSVRRIRFAMRSLSWLVARARVRLSAAGGSPGSIDKRCEVELTTEAGERIVVTSMARDWHSAMQSALGRASRSMLHRWQQERAGAAMRLSPA